MTDIGNPQVFSSSAEPEEFEINVEACLGIFMFCFYF